MRTLPLLIALPFVTLAACDLGDPSDAPDELDRAAAESETSEARPDERAPEVSIEPEDSFTFLRFRWLDLPDGAELRADHMRLRVGNHDAEAHDVIVYARADDGAAVENTIELARLRIEPGAEQELRLDLDALEIDPAQMIYSGRASVFAEIRDPDADNLRNIEFAPTLYFHPEGETWEFYGEAVFRRHAGDFAGRHGDEVDEPGVVIDRFTYAGNDLRTEWGTLDHGRFWVGGAEGPVAYDPDLDLTLPELLPAELGDEWQPPTHYDLPAGDKPVPTGTSTYTTCFRWDLQTRDSSQAGGGSPGYSTPTGVIEDMGITANDPSVWWRARGVRVKITATGFSQTIDTDTEGCTTWSGPSGTSFNVRVYGYATDSAGNYARIHNATVDFDSDVQPSYPGSTYSIYHTGYTPTANGTDYITVGNDDDKWTAMAVLGYSLYRYHNGISNSAFHVGFTTGCSSSYYGYPRFNDGRSYIALGRCTSGTTLANLKFQVAHELGHGMMFKGADDLGPSFSGIGSGDRTKADPTSGSYSMGCDTGPTVGSDDGYEMFSYEWSRLAMKEAAAHFYSARVFNNWGTDGLFVWGSNGAGVGGLQGYSLETTLGGYAEGSGGRLYNVCCPSVSGTQDDVCRSGAATIGDYLLAMWDWNSMELEGECVGDVPTLWDLIRFFARWANDYPALGTSYSSTINAISDMASANEIGSCAALAWIDKAVDNGVAN